MTVAFACTRYGTDADRSIVPRSPPSPVDADHDNAHDADTPTVRSLVGPENRYVHDEDCWEIRTSGRYGWGGPSHRTVTPSSRDRTPSAAGWNVNDVPTSTADTDTVTPAADADEPTVGG